MSPPEGHEQAQWARPRPDVNRGLRRGAWYRVLDVTSQTVTIDVNHTAQTVRREGVEIVDTPPQMWSVVPRPQDAVRVPSDWGDRYALCPACRNRTPIKSSAPALRCPRCAGVFQIAWEGIERSPRPRPDGHRSEGDWR